MIRYIREKWFEASKVQKIPLVSGVIFSIMGVFTATIYFIVHSIVAQIREVSNRADPIFDHVSPESAYSCLILVLLGICYFIYGLKVDVTSRRGKFLNVSLFIICGAIGTFHALANIQTFHKISARFPTVNNEFAQMQQVYGYGGAFVSGFTLLIPSLLIFILSMKKNPKAE